jgi:hypothetical protein
MFKKKKNLGILHKDEDVADYILGASPIEHEVRLFDGNWRDYLPKGENQKENGVETMSCVTFSALNCVEMQLNWMLKHGKMSQKARKFLIDNYYIEDDVVNLSDKFNAILSNTQPQGNYLTYVVNSIRNDGCIPEGALPFGNPDSWEEYHDKDQIEDDMIGAGKEFLKHFTIQYEWIHTTNSGGLKEDQYKDRLHHLRHAPIQVATQYHATSFYLGVDKVRWGQFDHYKPYIRDRDWEYNIPVAMKILVTEKSMYTAAQIKAAKTEMKKIMKDRKAPYFFRPDKNGEAYLMDSTGAFRYLKGIKCPLFDSIIAEGYVTPISEDLWTKVKAAEIK